MSDHNTEQKHDASKSNTSIPWPNPTWHSTKGQPFPHPFQWYHETNYIAQSLMLYWSNYISRSLCGEAKSEASAQFMNSPLPPSVPALDPNTGTKSCFEVSAQHNDYDSIPKLKGKLTDPSMVLLHSILKNPADALKLKLKEQGKLMRRLLKYVDEDERLVQLSIRARIIGRLDGNTTLEQEEICTQPFSPSKIWDRMKDIPINQVYSERKKIENTKRSKKRKVIGDDQSYLPPKVNRKCDVSYLLMDISPTKVKENYGIDAQDEGNIVTFPAKTKVVDENFMGQANSKNAEEKDLIKKCNNVHIRSRESETYCSVANDPLLDLRSYCVENDLEFSDFYT